MRNVVRGSVGCAYGSILKGDEVSDQWGQQQPTGPQGPYNQPQGPYGQPQSPQNPYGQPVAPQNPYDQPPMQPPPMPMQPVTPQNPYGQPQGVYGAPGQFPQQPGYGYQQPAPPASKKNQNMIISGAVVLVVIVAGVVFFATKGSGSHSGSGGGNVSATGTSVSGQVGTRTQAQSCAAWKTEQSTMNSQDPESEADTITALEQDVPALQTIAGGAQAGALKTQMQKLASDFDSLEGYLKANPDIETSSETPPTQFVTIAESLDSDISAVDSTCGIPDDSASGSGDSGF